MSQTELTRLTITWSKDTDVALRSHLGAQGLKKGALSKFVEDAVKWRLLDQTVSQVRKAFADLPARELHSLIEDSVTSARREKRRERNVRSHK
jgi:hypothetical protein